MVEGGKDSASMEEEAAATTSSREVEGSKMEFRIATMGFSTVRMHSCADTVVASSVINVESEMKEEADFLAIEHGA
ncbi:unnamed protein product [Phytophthora fragariaefolia]|uniref:Unnamed protein product n=1 Tax=Phytophthora fragariaefolia TaxID=1490495 RepID=A0A9W6TVG8_9STRA|nr:unnamed protein product [Phytophthora fragariaefolia]